LKNQNITVFQQTINETKISKYTWHIYKYAVQFFSYFNILQMYYILLAWNPDETIIILDEMILKFRQNRIKFGTKWE
jgi:hypothetical protein